MAEGFSGRKAMGAIGSPVFFVTSARGEERGILTANMIAGISFSPPLVSVSISKHSHTGRLIDEGRVFALNIIPPSLMDLAKKIGSSTGNKIDKFDEFEIAARAGEATGCPLVIDALTALECSVESATDIGKHTLYIARVVAYHDMNRGTPLYLYHGRYFSIGDELGSFM